MTTTTENSSYHIFTIGAFKCIAISDGFFDYNPGHIFANRDNSSLQSILSRHKISSDTITTPYTFLYVDTGVHQILVDMGAGKLGPNTGLLKENLISAGVSPEEIDTVIITHAHPDHIGGTLDEHGEPNYPNAQYYISDKEIDFWYSDSAVAKVEKQLSIIVPAEVFIKVARGQLDPIKNKIKTISKETEILPGVSVIFAPGHTPGHLVVVFTSEGNKLFFTSDTVLFPFLLQELEVIGLYDLNPEEAFRSKKKIMDMISESNDLMLAQHFAPFPGMGHIQQAQKGWIWEPVE